MWDNAILCHLHLVTCIDNDPAIDCNCLVHNFTLKVKCRQNRTEIPSLLAINFGIWEMFAILNFPYLVTCINNVNGIDCNLLIYNFTFKVKSGQNWTEIPSLFAINFGICEIIVILYHLNLVTCIDNFSAIDSPLLVYNFILKVKSTKLSRNSKFACNQFWDMCDICHSELSKPCHLYW